MKKKCALAAVIMLLAGVLSACGKEIESVKEIKASDYVTLGEYTGIEVTVTDPAVIAEENVEADMEQLAAMNAVAVEVTDRTDVKEGDTVNIDYTGYRDGVAFENGAAKGDNLTIGSGRFIPGFEDGLIGKNVGETVMLDLTFPDDYSNAEMAGAEVTFEVKINSISIMEPQELTIDFIKQNMQVECNTIEEFREYLYNIHYEDAVSANQDEIVSDIVSELMDNSVFKEPPEAMVNRYQSMQIADVTAELAAYNTSLDTYMQTYMGMEREEYMEMFRQSGVAMAKQYIMFQAIADAEDLNLSDKEFKQEMEKYSSEQGYESVKAFKEEVGEDVFYDYLMSERVIEFLVDNAVVYSEA